MSEVQTTQAVVDDPKVSAQPDAAGQDARVDDGDDLDKLLAEFDDSKTKAAPQSTQPEPKAGTDNDLKAHLEPLQGQLNALQQRQFKQDMDATIKVVRGELDSEFFDDSFLKAWIDSQAVADPRLATAWVNRDNNPKQFQKVVETLGRNFVKKYGKLPDKGATDDREAVTAAVRGASTKAPEGKAPDLKGLSNSEFRETVKKVYGYTPSA